MMPPGHQEKLAAAHTRRHAANEEMLRLAKLGREYELLLAAEVVARRQHPCTRRFLIPEARTGAFLVFECACGEAIHVTDMMAVAEASALASGAAPRGTP